MQSTKKLYALAMVGIGQSNTFADSNCIQDGRRMQRNWLNTHRQVYPKRSLKLSVRRIVSWLKSVFEWWLWIGGSSLFENDCPEGVCKEKPFLDAPTKTKISCPLNNILMWRSCTEDYGNRSISVSTARITRSSSARPLVIIDCPIP